MLLQLPAELIHQIASHLGYDASFTAFCLTARPFHRLLNPILYQQSENNENGYATRWAAQNGRIQTIQQAILCGCRVDDLGTLSIAVNRGEAAIVDLLLSHSSKLKSNINTCDSLGSPMLYRACAFKHKNLIWILLQHGADPRILARKTLHGQVFPQGQWTRDGEHILYLKERKMGNMFAIDWSTNGFSPLGMAVSWAEQDLVRALLDAGANPRGEISPPENNIVVEGEMLGVLSSYCKGLSIHEIASQIGAFFRSAAHRSVDGQMSLGEDEAGQKIMIPYNLSDENPILAACLSNNHTVVELLLAEAGAGGGAVVDMINAEVCERSASCIAVMFSYLQTLDTLLRYNPGLMISKGDSDTLLHIAARKGDVVIAKRILNHFGSHILELKDSESRTALHLAVLGHERIIEVANKLLQNESPKEELDQSDKGWMRELHGLIELGICRAHDVNQNWFDYSGDSDLPWSILGTHGFEAGSKMVEYLIEAGADITAKTSSGQTAVHLAASYGYTGIFKILLDAHASKSISIDCSICDGVRCHPVNTAQETASANRPPERNYVRSIYSKLNLP